MCTQKKRIKIQFSEDKKDLIWKLPYQLVEKARNNHSAEIMGKCGWCYECRRERARKWIYKLWLEAKDYKEKCFITLTLDRKKVKNPWNLSKRDLQLFIKRLRKNTGAKIKYFGAGEYGELKGRAHYHIIILGYIPKDIKLWKVSEKGNKIYRSKEIDKTWNKGITTVQAFHMNEIPYISLYTDTNQKIKKYNYKELEHKKMLIKELHIKYGIAIRVNNQYFKTRNLKDLDKELYKSYKREYNKINDTIELKKQPEFNIWSNGIGFNRYIKDKYYKYDLILDEEVIERPKEFLRKIIENQDKYSEEVVNETIIEIIKRKEYVEDNYIEENDTKKYLEVKIKERLQIDQAADRIKLYKKNISDF